MLAREREKGLSPLAQFEILDSVFIESEFPNRKEDGLEIYI